MKLYLGERFAFGKNRARSQRERPVCVPVVEAGRMKR